MSSEGLTVKKMRAEIKSGFKKLGFDFKFDPDRALTTYRRGKPLTIGELKALPDGAVVWVWYKEHGERGPRMNGAMRVTKGAADATGAGGEEYWSLDDGSSFGAEFTPASEYNDKTRKFVPAAADAECFDDACGQGEMILYHATGKNLQMVVATKRRATRVPMSEVKRELGDPKTWAKDDAAYERDIKKRPKKAKKSKARK